MVAFAKQLIQLCILRGGTCRYSKLHCKLKQAKSDCDQGISCELNNQEKGLMSYELVPPVGGEVYEYAGRVFALVPEDAAQEDWTFVEWREGKWAKAQDLVDCSASKSFVKFHIRSQL